VIPCTAPYLVVPAEDITVGMPVAAWDDDDGHPMIAAGDRLARADSVVIGTFEVMTAAEHDPQGIVALIPCDDPAQIGWALCNDGKVRTVYFSEIDGNASAMDFQGGAA
jgi:hypothetical protein